MHLKYKKFIRCISANPVSRFGTALVTSTFIIFLFMELLTVLGIVTNAYVGLLIYLILPTLFAIGLVMVYIGWRVVIKISQKSLAELLADNCGHDELKEGIWGSKLMRTIGFLTLINIAFLGAASFRTLHFMDSASFCGTACHKVMNPEWVAYQVSPHARVKCVECHVGEGIGALIDSKINGAWQMVSLAFSLYEKPIPTPVHNLRPARETCEKCHWPDKFLGNRMKTIKHYDFDEESTLKYTTLDMKIGGSAEGLESGIHWHISEKNEVRYMPFDEKRVEMKWVEVKQPDGKFKRYNNIHYSEADSEDELEIRELDCVDCHNRATHIYENPEKAIDERIGNGRLSRNLPFIKREGLAAITKNYSDKTQGQDFIRKRIDNFYPQHYPEVFRACYDQMEIAISVLQELYFKNIHPGMDIEWGSYPNYIGHRNSPGCFRCHNQDLIDTEGNSISYDCTLCHSILAYEADKPFDYLMSLDIEETEYPMRRYLQEEFKKTSNY